MIGVHVKLIAFRAHPATQPTTDSEGNIIPSPLIRIIDKKRTPIVYEGDESISFLCDLSGGIQEAIDANPDIVSTFTIEQLLGNPDRQAVDEFGVKQIIESVEPGTEDYQEQTGTIAVPIMVLEKQITPGWSVEQVQNRNADPDDDVPDGQFEEGTYQVWTYSGTPETDDEGNEIFPPKYTMVEVDSGEVREDPVYETKTRTVMNHIVTPILDPLEPDADVVALYARFWPRTPYEVTEEDGGTTMVTPPVLHGTIAGHWVPEYAR